MLTNMQAATNLERGAPGMEAQVKATRSEMNDFVAFYRRQPKVAGMPSFSTLYTAINVLVCFVRFYKFAKVQERLNIVNQTLAKAAPDLLHFTISFLLSFLCFAVMGCVM